ncbi:hypothetical protein TNCV_4446731 [Trichonephila clavipes]|nr:hypothetical protein TNCV_4446731 [Trichonephila clavipes]
MLEARDFTVFTDHKPSLMLLGKKVTSVLHGRSVSWISSLSSPQILYTFQDLTILLLMFSLVFLQSPSQVKLTMTVLLRHNRLIRSFTTLIASGTSFELKKVTFPKSSTEIMCGSINGHSQDPYIPKQHRQDVFSAIHNLSHPGIPSISAFEEAAFCLAINLIRCS